MYPLRLGKLRAKWKLHDVVCARQKIAKCLSNHFLNLVFELAVTFLTVEFLVKKLQIIGFATYTMSVAL